MSLRIVRRECSIDWLTMVTRGSETVRRVTVGVSCISILAAGWEALEALRQSARIRTGARKRPTESEMGRAK